MSLFSYNYHRQLAGTSNDTHTNNTHSEYSPYISLFEYGIDGLSTLLSESLLHNETHWECNNITSINHYISNLTTTISNTHYSTLCVHDSHTIHHESHDDHHLPDGVYIVLYCAFVLFLGCLFKYLQHRFHIPIPYTVILLAAGILLEIFEIAKPVALGALNEGFQDVRIIDAHMILIIFIPGLIFESAFNTNWHIFLKEFEQALMLAGPGVIINIMLAGGVMHYFAEAIAGYDWSWSFCLMFGAIVSATDPVAVVALLKDLGASKRLSTLIEAESLLNDGTAYVAFVLMRDYAASPENTTFSKMIIQLLQLAAGGTAMGIGFGILTYWSLAQVFSDHEIEITLTLSLAYLAFYTGDIATKVSGVLTCVFMGLWVSKNRSAVSPAVEHTMHHFWELLGFIANTILFFATGQIIAYRIHEASTINFLYDTLLLIVLYICLHISRGLGIWQMFPVLQNTGYGCTLSDAMVMVYGGLRGAIGLALALIVETTTVQEGGNKLQFMQKEKDRVLYLVCGIVFLTLIINASTIKYLVGWLGLNKPPADTAALFRSATEHLNEETHHYLNNKMKFDKHYHGANWTKVEELQPNYSKLYESIFEDDIDKNNIDDNKENDEELDEIASIRQGEIEEIQKKEVEKRLIQVMKASYWSQFEKGLISSDAVSILTEAADTAMDENDIAIQMRSLKKFFTIPSHIKFIYSSRFSCVKKLAERLLYSNLGLAIELSSGLIFAAEKAKEYGYTLKKSMNEKDVEFVLHQVNGVQKWVAKSADQVENVYPDVHSAIKTSHAAHALLHHQEHELEHLYHRGHLDDQEYSKLSQLVSKSLNRLFHTGYNSLLRGRSDENILLQSPLFSELSFEQKKIVKARAVPENFLSKGQDLIKEGTRSHKIFVITRGSIGVYESDLRRTQRSRTTSQINKDDDTIMNDDEITIRGSSVHDLNGKDFSIRRTSGFETKVYTHEPGSIIDVYPLLIESQHHHTFRIIAEPCHGYWLDSKLLKELKDSNIDFWDTLWKYSAVDVIRYYFANEDDAFKGIDLSELHEKVFASPLGYFEPDKKILKKSQIRITKGMGILLTGSVSELSSRNEPVEAPAVLKKSPDPYIAFSPCVVLYLDFTRGQMMNNQINLMTGKLAKLMGNVTVEYDDNDIDSDDSDEELSYDDSDLDPEENIVDDDNKDKNDDEKEDLGKIPSRKNLGLAKTVPEPKIKHLKMNLRDTRLPLGITTDNINTNWTQEQSFEVMKYIIHKHQDLYTHIKNFYVKDKQNENQARQSRIISEKDLKALSNEFAKPGEHRESGRHSIKSKVPGLIPQLSRHQSRFLKSQQYGQNPNRISTLLASPKKSNKKKYFKRSKSIVTSSKFRAKSTRNILTDEMNQKYKQDMIDKANNEILNEKKSNNTTTNENNNNDKKPSKHEQTDSIAMLGGGWQVDG